MIVVVFVFTVLFLTLITRFVAGRHIGTNQSYTRAVSLNVWYSFAVLMAQGDYLFIFINQPNWNSMCPIESLFKKEDFTRQIVGLFVSWPVLGVSSPSSSSTLTTGRSSLTFRCQRTNRSSTPSRIWPLVKRSVSPRKGEVYLPKLFW